jgi:hypothetical protein
VAFALQRQSPEAPLQRHIALVLTFTLLPLAGWTAGAWRATRGSQQWLSLPTQETAPPVTGTGDHGWSSLPDPVLDEPDADVERDLYGNDVSTAVATYKSDRTGSLYEEHSPNTQVARLKPPIS